MSSLERFCRKPVVTVLPHETVSDTAVKMRDHHVGAVIVVEEGKPVGIVTDRDIVLRLVIEGGDAKTTPVRYIMSRSVAILRSDAKIDDAVSSIQQAGVRRLPIVDAQGIPVGMVTLDDLFVLVAGELSAIAGAVQTNRGP